MTCSGGSFQTTKNPLPVLWHTNPLNSSTSPWTTSATWFTSTTIPLWSTSVIIGKSIILICPKTASILVPDPPEIAVCIPRSKFRIFLPIIPVPASPNPTTSKVPIRKIVCSRRTISESENLRYASVTRMLGLSPLSVPHTRRRSGRASQVSLVEWYWRSRLVSLSDRETATRGLALIWLTIRVIRPIGTRTSPAQSRVYTHETTKITIK